MKNTYLLFFIFLFSITSYACDCNTPSAILEFYNSDYVFEGKVISKIYSKDFLTYTVTFDINKHYKNGDNPKQLSFILRSEGKYQKEITSCEWIVNLNEKWLVYAYKINGNLNFEKYCSNSQLLCNEPLYYKYQRMLDNANSFNVDNFIFNDEFRTNFSSSNPELDSIFLNGKKKEYKKYYSSLYLLIGKNGNLISANKQNQILPIYDSVFGLQQGLEIDKNVELTEFEQDAIDLVKQKKMWDIQIDPISKKPISYFQFIHIEYDLKGQIWKYELR